MELCPSVTMLEQECGNPPTVQILINTGAKFKNSSFADQQLLGNLLFEHLRHLRLSSSVIKQITYLTTLTNNPWLTPHQTRTHTHTQHRE